MILLQTTLGDRHKSGVYLALQKDPLKTGGYSKTIAVQKCGGKPYELALRFAGCCMKCGPCFASGYSWVNRFESSKRVTCAKTLEDLIRDYREIPHPQQDYQSYNWLRILGGEPLLNDDYVKFLFDAIGKISEVDSQKFNNGVIIQTNGLFVGQGNTRVLRAGLQSLLHTNPKVKVCIEVSIKGTNVKEFELITRSTNRSKDELSKFERLFGWDLGAFSPDDLFEFNIGAYYKLIELASDLPNIQPTIIAGFGVNESYLLKEGKSNSRITLIFKDNKPIYHPDFWSSDFKALYNDFTGRASKTFDTRFSKMPMYGIKDLIQYSWVVPTLDQGKQVYGSRWYDRKFADEGVGRNIALEESFADILSKFFLVDNRTYYSTLINWKT